MNSVLQTDLSLSNDEGGSVLLEQEPWDKLGNTTSALDVVNYLSDFLLATKDYVVNCEVDTDGYYFVDVIYAYPSPSDLVFETGVTHGFKGVGRIESYDVEKQVGLSFALRVELAYPPSASGIQIEWLNNKAYDKDGSPTPPPAWKLEGRTVVFSKQVYATYTVKYSTRRYVYDVRVTPRDDVEENAFESVFWARWSGGCRMLKLNTPSDAEEDLKLNADCKGRSLMNYIDNDDDNGERKLEGFAVYDVLEIDYCSQTDKDDGL